MTQKKEYRLFISFVLSIRYIDDLLFMSIPSYGDFIHGINPHCRYYEVSLISLITLEVDEKIKAMTKLDDFSLRIVINILFSSVETSLQLLCMELIRFTRASNNYANFLYRAILTIRPLEKGRVATRMNSLYVRHL